MALIYYDTAENLLLSKQCYIGEKLSAANIVSTYEHYAGERIALLQRSLYARLLLYCLDASLA
jgi:hypothetical protein